MRNRRFPSPLAEPAAPGHFRNRRPACGLRLPGLPSRSGAGIPSSALQRIEAIDDPLLVNFPGTEHDRRKLGLVRTVGKGLALDRHAVAVPVLVSADTSRAPLEPVPGVYLYSGLSRADRHPPAALRIVQKSEIGQPAGFPPVDRPTMIVPVAEPQRLVVSVYIASERLRFAEIHRRPLDRRPATGRDLVRVGLQKARCVEFQHILEGAALGLAAQVEIGMVGQGDHRWGGGAGIKRDFEFAVVVPVVNDLGIQIARITLVAVGAQQREDDPVGFDPTVPQLVGKTGKSYKTCFMRRLTLFAKRLT